MNIEIRGFENNGNGFVFTKGIWNFKRDYGYCVGGGASASDSFARAEEIAFINQAKVMKAFSDQYDWRGALCFDLGLRLQRYGPRGD